jgi:protein involved in polysaccharide export with SLBB domain
MVHSFPPLLRRIVTITCSLLLIAVSSSAQFSPDLPSDLSPEAEARLLQLLQDPENAALFQELRLNKENAASRETEAFTLHQGHNASAATFQGTAPLKPEEPSAVEKRYRERYAVPEAEGLKQFGYDVFRYDARPSVMSAVPDESYVLGPGDSVKIRIRGAGEDLEIRETIAPDGTLDAPRIGIVSVAGKSVQRARAAVLQQARKYLRGVEIDMSLIRLRSVDVYVVGEVERPGLHHVPAFGTVLTALSTAGGIKKSGSLRSISLKRNGRTASSLDMYDVLLKGKRSADAMLKSGDLVFVPRLGDTAAVIGAAGFPSIYELKRERWAADLLNLAGGALPQGFSGRMHLHRFEGGSEYRIIDMNLGSAARAKLKNGDVLELGFINKDRPRTVRVTGHVLRKEVLDFRAGLMLSQVLGDRQKLLPEAVTDFALLKRYDPVSTRSSVTTFPLQQVYEGSFDMSLSAYDEIEILSRQQFNIREPVRLGGAVWQEGEYDHRPGLRLIDLLALGGGVRFGADTGKVEISRKILSGQKAETRHFIVDFTKEPGFSLQPYDYIFVPQAKDAVTFRTAVISGEVHFPGEYRLKDGERLSDLIERAGGFTQEAYFYGAVYTSPKALEIQQENIERLVGELKLRGRHLLHDRRKIDLDAEDAALAAASAEGMQALIARLEGIEATGRVSIMLTEADSFRGSAYDIPVGAGDTLHVPKKPGFVSVVGSVFTPGSFLHQPELTVGTYLDKSGGPTRTADEKHVYVVKANGEVISRAQSKFGRRSFLSTKLMPGDTIVVPEDFERIPYLRIFSDIADIVFKIATTAGIVFAIL